MPIPGDLRQQLEEAIRECFDRDELDRLLTYKLHKNSAQIVLPNNLTQAVFEIFSAASRQGWIGPFLRALKTERPNPESATFRQLIDGALLSIPHDDPGIFHWHDEDVLPPCDRCWWREAQSTGLNAIVARLRESETEMIRGPGLRKLVASTLQQLTDNAGPSLGRQITESANQFLEEAFGKEAVSDSLNLVPFRDLRILSEFNKADNQMNWAAVLSEADARGVKTLVSLFLSVFLADQRLRSLADRNLRNLHKHRERRRDV